jgi:hypothetical protein
MQWNRDYSIYLPLDIRRKASGKDWRNIAGILVLQAVEGITNCTSVLCQ